MCSSVNTSPRCNFLTIDSKHSISSDVVGVVDNDRNLHSIVLCHRGVHEGRRNDNIRITGLYENHIVVLIVSIDFLAVYDGGHITLDHMGAMCLHGDGHALCYTGTRGRILVDKYIVDICVGCLGNIAVRSPAVCERRCVDLRIIVCPCEVHVNRCDSPRLSDDGIGVATSINCDRQLDRVRTGTKIFANVKGVVALVDGRSRLNNATNVPSAGAIANLITGRVDCL